jgi:hypothetical protein
MSFWAQNAKKLLNRVNFFSLTRSIWVSKNMEFYVDFKYENNPSKKALTEKWEV